MMCKILVEKTGASAIYGIYSTEDAPTDKIPTDQKLVSVEAPGVPINMIHWDGTQIVSGPYVSVEDAAEAQKAIDVQNTKGDIDAVIFEYADKLAALLLARETDLSLTTDEVTFLQDYRTRFAAWETAKA